MQPKPLGRQRKWFKLDDAIAELSVHKPAQCKYVRLLCKKENQTSETNSPASTTTTTMPDQSNKIDNGSSSTICSLTKSNNNMIRQ